MRTVTVLIAQTAPVSFPAGTTFGGYQYILTPGGADTPPATVAVDTALTHVFTDVAPGIYEVSVCALDATGNTLPGTSVSTTITVPADAPVPTPTPTGEPVTITAPSSLSVTIS